MDISLITGLCSLNSAGFWGFDFSYAPLLLYYAYIPVGIIGVIFSLLFVRHDVEKNYSYFPLVTISFLGWILNELIQWVYVYNYGIYNAWQASAFFSTLLFASIWIFGLQIFTQNKLRLKHVLFPIGVLLFIVVMAQTSYNIQSYNLEQCEGVIGPLWDIIYGFEFLTVLMLAYLQIRNILEKKLRLPRTYLLFALSLFALLFFVPAFLGDTTNQYTIELFASIGMFVLLFVFGYLWVTTDIVKSKLIAAQLAFYSSLFLVFSLILIPSFTVMKLFVGIILIPIAVLGQIATVSSQKEISQRKELEQLNIEKSEFLSFASHQLKSPLTALKWGVESLLDPASKNPEQEKTNNSTLQQIHGTITRMIHVVQDFLSMSKIQQGALILNPASVSINSFVNRIVHDYMPLAEQKGLRLEIKLLEQDISAYIDEVKLEQAFAIFVDNAIKYSPQGMITVVVQRKEGDQLYFAVVDQGKGLEPGEDNKLFNKFSRGSSAGVNKAGSGIGLYLAREIVELHHGTIGAKRNDDGVGSVFWFIIPIQEDIASVTTK